MKRGFLNNTRRLRAPTQKQVNSQKATSSSDKDLMNRDDTVIPDVQIVAFDLIYFNETFRQPICTARTQALTLNTTIHPSSLICTRVPSTSTDKYGTTACVLYARDQAKLLTETPNYPSSPIPFDYAEPLPYEIRDTQTKGKAMFATRALKTGDLIMVERPLIVVPINTDLSAIADCPEILRNMGRVAELQGISGSLVGILEPMLEIAFSRMSMKDQKSYMELANAHTSDGTPKLCGTWRTNVFGVNNFGEKDCRYGAVLNEMSRMNHSCRPNCANSFQKDSFSFELRATKSIAAGEEIFFRYCPGLDAPTAQRQAHLKLYGFSCTCISCVPTPTHPSNDAIRTSVVGRGKSLRERYYKFDGETRGTIAADRKYVLSMYDENVAVMRDMRQEGMDGHECYREAIELHVFLCTAMVSLSDASESRRWLDMAHKYYDSSKKLSLALYGSKDPVVVSHRS